MTIDIDSERKWLAEPREKAACLLAEVARRLADSEGYAIDIVAMPEVWSELLDFVSNIEQRYGELLDEYEEALKEIGKLRRRAEALRDDRDGLHKQRDFAENKWGDLLEERDELRKVSERRRALLEKAEPFVRISGRYKELVAEIRAEVGETVSPST